MTILRMLRTTAIAATIFAILSTHYGRDFAIGATVPARWVLGEAGLLAPLSRSELYSPTGWSAFGAVAFCVAVYIGGYLMLGKLTGCFRREI